MIALDDPRMQAAVTYTNADDGIWLVYGEYPNQQEINLDFEPSVQVIIKALEQLRP